MESILFKGKFIKFRLSEFDFNRINMLANLYTRGNVSQLIRDAVLDTPVRYVKRLKKKVLSKEQRENRLKLYQKRYLKKWRAKKRKEKKRAAKGKQAKP